MTCAAQTCCRREASKPSIQNGYDPSNLAVRRRTNKSSEELLDMPLADIDHSNGNADSTIRRNSQPESGSDPNDSVTVNMF